MPAYRLLSLPLCENLVLWIQRWMGVAELARLVSAVPSHFLRWSQRFSSLVTGPCLRGLELALLKLVGLLMCGSSHAITGKPTRATLRKRRLPLSLRQRSQVWSTARTLDRIVLTAQATARKQRSGHYRFGW